MEEGEGVVVVDNGGGWIKGGIAGEDMPSVIFPTICSRARGASSSNNNNSFSRFFSKA